MEGNEVLIILSSLAGIVAVLGVVFKTMVISFIKQQEKITQAFLDSVNNSIIAQNDATATTRDMAEHLKDLVTEVSVNSTGIKQIWTKCSQCDRGMVLVGEINDKE